MSSHPNQPGEYFTGPTQCIPRTLNLLPLPNPLSPPHSNKQGTFQGTLLLTALRTTTLGNLAPLLDIIPFLQLTCCFCFLFNYYFETHMKYFGSTSSSGNSKLKPLLSCSWPSRAPGRGVGAAQTDAGALPSTAASKHRSRPSPSLQEQNHVGRYTATSSHRGTASNPCP